MKSVILALSAGLLASSAASATTILTFRYDSLSGNFNAGTGAFDAHAVNTIGGLQTQGNVARQVTPTGNANFAPGFLDDPGPADFTLGLTISNIGGSVLGVGSFTATDADGDRITGNINGSWILVGGQELFNGLLSNIILHSDADGIFEGTNGGSWAMADLGSGPFDGAIIQLTANATGFTQSFTATATNVDGQVIAVPLPAAALMGLGGLAFAARLRRTARGSC